jgi:hypothetical protein
LVKKWWKNTNFLTLGRLSKLAVLKVFSLRFQKRHFDWYPTVQMLIHPTFKFVPCSWPKSPHASSNHHRPTTTLHSAMDMLRSNVFSISNPTPWPTIWIKPIYLFLITKITRFNLSMVQFSYLWANLRRARTCLQLKNGFFCCTCAPNPSSLKARLTRISYNNLNVSDRSCFAITYAVPSQPSITRVTQRLFSLFAKSYAHPPLCLSISPPTSFLRCATEDWSWPLKWQLCEWNTASKLHQSLVFLSLRQ